MPKLTKSYQEALLQALQNPQEAAEYLTAALEDGDSAVFLLALRNVADAQGVKTVAEQGPAQPGKSLPHALGTGESSAWQSDRAARCPQLTVSDHGEISPASAFFRDGGHTYEPRLSLYSPCCSLTAKNFSSSWWKPSRP